MQKKFRVHYYNTKKVYCSKMVQAFTSAGAMEKVEGAVKATQI